MISASRTAVAWGSLLAALYLAPTSALAGPIAIDNVRESPLALTAAVLPNIAVPVPSGLPFRNLFREKRSVVLEVLSGSQVDASLALSSEDAGGLFSLAADSEGDSGNAWRQTQAPRPLDHTVNATDRSRMSFPAEDELPE